MAPTAQIRRMTAKDLPRVLEIAASTPELPRWPESAYANALNAESTPQGIALVAVDHQADRIQGFAVASILPPEAELESIGVTAENRRRGLARMLFDGLIEELRAAKVHEITLEVRASNHAALAFYRSAGFGQTGLRRLYYVDPIEDAVLMRLHLS
jgi:ribosomal-protein-alanine N-acetyltransferase